MAQTRALLRLLNPALCGFCGQVQSQAGSTCRACGKAIALSAIGSDAATPSSEMR